MNKEDFIISLVKKIEDRFVGEQMCQSTLHSMDFETIRELVNFKKTHPELAQKLLKEIRNDWDDNVLETDLCYDFEWNSHDVYLKHNVITNRMIQVFQNAYYE